MSQDRESITKRTINVKCAFNTVILSPESANIKIKKL